MSTAEAQPATAAEADQAAGSSASRLNSDRQVIGPLLPIGSRVVSMGAASAMLGCMPSGRFERLAVKVGVTPALVVDQRRYWLESDVQRIGRADLAEREKSGEGL